MKVITGRVVDGKIQLSSPLEDGTTVAILAADETGFKLSSEDEQELADALASIRRGEFEDGHAVLAELKHRN
ncbi:MAG TPA: hypothetical protein VNA04_02935 [Thermoanaerobaculia bacterium]|nr:hypothetical protein [Thermoanaerobaculia bacterium]